MSAVSKVIYGNTTVIDITDSTVNANNLLSGNKAYGADGEPVFGALSVGSTINVTTSESELFGETITLTDGTTTLTTAFDNSGDATFQSVLLVGTLTLSCDGNNMTISVPTYGTYNIVFTAIPEGATVTPTDDIQTWLKCANILDKSYTTLAEVLADKATFETLIADSNACDYMARSTTWAVAEGLVPTMTSNTTPSGVASATSAMSGYEAYKAFDNNTSTAWIASSGSSGFDISLTYQFVNSVCANIAKVLVYNDGNAHAKNYSIEASNDGSTYTTLTSGVFENISTTQTVDLSSNTTEYQYYRLRITSMYAGANVAITELQYYKTDITTNQYAMELIGKYDYCADKLLSNATWASAIANSDYWDSVLQPLVPIMTSNTTPSGTASASSSWTNNYPAWHGFTNGATDGWIPNGLTGWIQYEFPTPVKAYVFTEYNHVTTNRPSTVSIEISEDGTNFTQIKSGISILGTNGFKAKEALDNTFACKYYRINTTAVSGSGSNYYPWLGSLQFYGRSSNEVLVPLVPTMTSNTTPSGECISNVADSSSYYKYYAFDKNTSTAWAGAQSGNSYIGYKFTQQVVVDKAYFKTANYYGRITSIKVQGSNDNFDSDIHDLSESITPTSDETTINLSSVGSYQYYRLYMSVNTAPIIYEVQFYQRAVQTNIVHSSANDTIYYLDEGSPVIVATTNSDGDGILDFNSLDDGTYTFYSSVAKDPSNLSNDYSKSIRITNTEYGGTTEMYLMPDTVKTLYWYGYKEDNLEELSTSNGWSVPSGYSFFSPTYQTNYVDINGAQNKTGGVGSKKSIDLSVLHTIAKGVTAVSANYGGSTAYPSKNLSSSSYNNKNYDSNTDKHYILNVDSTNHYVTSSVANARRVYLYALWHE